jgi:hypothetical protein
LYNLAVTPDQPTHSGRIAVRVAPQMRERLNRAIALTKISEADLVRAAVEAICEEVEQRGKITMPLHLSHDTQHFTRATTDPAHLNDR